MENVVANHWLIIANGEAKVPDLHHWMLNRQTIALDGAANALEKNHLFPDILMGDFDSVTPQLPKRWKQMGVQCLHQGDQNYTDLEKAIQFAISCEAADIVILNALGGRMDHELANIFFLKKYARRGLRMVICDGLQYIECLFDETRELVAPAGSYCGFFGMPRAIISSKGLKYEMENFLICLGGNESVANEFTFGTAKITVLGACLANYAVT